MKFEERIKKSIKIYKMLFVKDWGNENPIFFYIPKIIKFENSNLN